MNLFAEQESLNRQAHLPLAARMRPRSLSEFVGQQHLLGPGCILQRMLAADRLPSVVLFGPPGTGKTTLAELIARHTQRRFVSLNAAAIGVKELRDELERARGLVERGERPTLLFVDELHHFNKSQQTILLPAVEQGIVSFVTATTANPFFALITPLLSRSQIVELKPLENIEIVEILQRALHDPERGLGRFAIKVTDEALAFLADRSEGDARRALQALELCVCSQPADSTVGLSEVALCLGTKLLRYSRRGDEHYDVASAYIKSIRGSDPDAAIYWLARMLEAGEDPRFIARRLLIAAAEDVGNADPQALLVATAAFQAVEFLGMPECRIPLSQATLYVALAPKSNASLLAIDAAIQDIHHQRIQEVPQALQDRHYVGAARLHRGDGYLYPHDVPDGWILQDYVGREVSYYHPTSRGFEAELQHRLNDLRQRRQQQMLSADSNPSDGS